MYGDNAFRIVPTVFQSELDAAKKAKQVDFDDLEKRARDYAKVTLRIISRVHCLPVAAACAERGASR